jgi:hypothetical protein
MKIKHPYKGLSSTKFWNKFIAEKTWRELDFIESPKFKIKISDKVVTAGSCFAQHISRYMNKVGLSILNCEPAHPLLMSYDGDIEGYNQFSARYGNIYSSSQCLELIQQALGIIPIIEDFVEESSRWYDLIRPNIQKTGFTSLHEALSDRRYHLSQVSKMFHEADIFVFTLGLTEIWKNKITNHTYPVCPGTLHGIFDEEIHKFKNLDYSNILTDLKEIINILKIINPKIKIILTVSPVPLVATKTLENVLVASSYSKSVLRAVVGDIEQQYENVAYFPSYEIINSSASRGQYLANNLRDVTENGIEHVMSCFLSSFYNEINEIVNNEVNSLSSEYDSEPQQIQFSPECEELFNTPND